MTNIAPDRTPKFGTFRCYCGADLICPSAWTAFVCRLCGKIYRRPQ